jgi:signal transduction histidine kinase
MYSASFDRRQEFKAEYRLRRHDGVYRWVCDTGVPWFGADDSFAGCIGSCLDITESKLAVEALSRDNARLIEGLEQERTRIAREIHDDIGSSLAILGIELLRAGKPVSGTPGQRHPGIPEIYQKFQELSSRVSRISHQLHPPTLEYLGLAKAIEKECREFTEKRRMPVSFSCNDIPARLDPIVALSLLRVVQEALHNAAKHSRATRVAVDVIAAPTTLTLQVSDDGIGFDVEQSRLAPGIGLISMRERMRLIGGHFEIRSQPGKGTNITCRAPLAQTVTAPTSHS